MYNQAIQGKQKLLEWYEKNKDFPYFFIFNPQNRDSILDSSPNVPIEEYPFERSYAEFNHALTFLNENTTYGVRLQNKYVVNHPSNKRENYYRHEEDKPKKPQYQAQNDYIAGFDNEVLIGKIEKRSNELYNQRWINEQNQKLNQENGELKSKLEAALAKIKEHEDSVDGRKFATMAYNDLKPIFPDIYQSIKTYLSNPNPATIAGTATQTNIKPKVKVISKMNANTSNQTIEERLAAAFAKLYQADPEAVEVLEKIAEMATNNRQKYDLAKSLM